MKNNYIFYLIFNKPKFDIKLIYVQKKFKKI